MKQLLPLVAITVAGTVVWFLRGNIDATLVEAKSTEIASLQDTVRAKDQLLAQNDKLIDSGNASIRELQDKIKSDEDLLAKNDTQIADDKVAYDKLKSADEKIINSLNGDNQAELEVLKSQLQDKDSQIAALNEKLVQTISDYETKLNDLRSQVASATPDDGEKLFPADNGFEQQDIGPGAYNYFGTIIFNPNHVPMPDPVPNQTGWKFGGNAGLAANSGLYASNVKNGNHDGKTSSGGQAGFLQAKGSWISQVIKLPAGTYSVGFDFEARRDYEPANGLAVSLDGTELYVGAPTDVDHFTHVTTETITLTAPKECELKFRGLGALADPDGDHLTFIDNICINVINPHKHAAKKVADADTGGTK